MAISEWHIPLDHAALLTDRQIEGLLSGYIARKRFEAKVFLSVYAEAMKKPETGGTSLGALAAMGFGIQGA